MDAKGEDNQVRSVTISLASSRESSALAKGCHQFGYKLEVISKSSPVDLMSKRSPR